MTERARLLISLPASTMRAGQLVDVIARHPDGFVEVRHIPDLDTQTVQPYGWRIRADLVVAADG